MTKTTKNYKCQCGEQFGNREYLRKHIKEQASELCTIVKKVGKPKVVSNNAKKRSNRKRKAFERQKDKLEVQTITKNKTRVEKSKQQLKAEMEQILLDDRDVWVKLSPKEKYTANLVNFSLFKERQQHHFLFYNKEFVVEFGLEVFKEIWDDEVVKFKGRYPRVFFTLPYRDEKFLSYEQQLNSSNDLDNERIYEAALNMKAQRIQDEDDLQSPIDESIQAPLLMTESEMKIQNRQQSQINTSSYNFSRNEREDNNAFVGTRKTFLRRKPIGFVQKTKSKLFDKDMKSYQIHSDIEIECVLNRKPKQLRKCEVELQEKVDYVAIAKGNKKEITKLTPNDQEQAYQMAYKLHEEIMRERYQPPKVEQKDASTQYKKVKQPIEDKNFDLTFQPQLKQQSPNPMQQGQNMHQPFEVEKMDNNEKLIISKMGAWYGKELIDKYFQILNTSSRVVLCLNTFVFNVIGKFDNKSGAQLVQEELVKNNKSISDIKCIIIPIQRDKHWVLHIVCFEKQKIYCVDSFRKKDDLQIYKQEFSATKFTINLVKFKNWKCQISTADPQQKQDCDCGPAVCANAKSVLMNPENFMLKNFSGWNQNLTEQPEQLRTEQAIEILKEKIIK